MARSQDPLRIHLSLVSHTNIGKTTLARTLLMRDVGEVADRAHVTETTDDYVLARGPDGSELVLWDTPGFGNSVALAKRLEGRSNPIGWLLSEVWDRLTNKAFWLDQRAVRHIRDISSVVLYLVNIAEHPAETPYIGAEMKLLSWIGKPVVVLLNQMGKPRSPEEESAEVKAWETALAQYDFVKKVLPMDAFARCWIQEEMLFTAIGDALPAEKQSAYRTLQSVWRRSRQAAYASSVDAMARHLWHTASAHMPLPVPSLKERAINVGRRFGFFKDEHDAVADAQTALASQAADSFCSLTSKLIEVNGLKGSGVSKEIFRRMNTDWNLAVYSLDPQSAAAIGTGIGVVSGATAGLATDISTGGLSLGLGTLVGGLIGAVGGLGAAHAYNLTRSKSGADLSWSDHAMSGFLLEAVLLYLAVAHFGRGRGDWEESESPEFWKTACENAIKAQKVSFKDIRGMDPDDGVAALLPLIDSVLKRIFEELYGDRSEEPEAEPETEEGEAEA